MTASEDIAREAVLKAEFARFARFLVGHGGTPYQAAKYVDIHSKISMNTRNRFDAFLWALAQQGVVGLALADAYSGTLYGNCLLRKKLMATIGVLETSPPSFTQLDMPDSGGRLAAIFFMGLHGVAAVLTLICAALICTPAKILLERRS